MEFSQIINQYTELNGYQLPLIDDMVNILAKFKLFSTFDLKSAYHQILIMESDMKYTDFEANWRLYHFRRIPFQITNGVADFQGPWIKLLERRIKLYLSLSGQHNSCRKGSRRA